MNSKATFWKMNLLYKGKSSFKFCNENNILGFGWCLKNTQANSFDDYISLSEKEKYYSNDGKLNYDLRCAVNAFDAMKKGDIVLINDSKGNYYLRRIDSCKPMINQGSQYVEENVTCNISVTEASDAISKIEMKKIGVPYQSYTSRHTVERFNLKNPNSKKVVEFLKKCVEDFESKEG